MFNESALVYSGWMMRNFELLIFHSNVYSGGVMIDPKASQVRLTRGFNPWSKNIFVLHRKPKQKKEKKKVSVFHNEVQVFKKRHSEKEKKQAVGFISFLWFRFSFFQGAKLDRGKTWSACFLFYFVYMCNPLLQDVTGSTVLDS